MASLLAKVGKLRGMSLHELSVRAAQACAIVAERAGLSSDAHSRAPGARPLGSFVAGDGLDADALLHRFREDGARAFLPSFRDPSRAAALLRERWPASVERSIARAEAVLEGRFEIFGQELRFGDPIDWQLDPVSGRRAPLVHWSRIPFLDADVVGDHKVIWELNRHQHFYDLGKAYWCTGDERYAAVFAAHVAAWMEANPPKLGINWASSLELAFRAISWIWALHFFRDSAHLTPGLYRAMLECLHLHGRHIERFLSTYFSPNTHLTGEALGLAYLGVALPELRHARRWRELGLRILTEQIHRQVRPDGVYFEQSTYYHRYTADFYNHLLALWRARGRRTGLESEPRLVALFDHLMYLTRPDGTTPLIGDDDGGLTAAPDRPAPNDFRGTLATAAVLFSRPDYRFVAGDAAEQVFWLLGAEGLAAYDGMRPVQPAGTSVAFPDGGYFVMRDGWGADARYMLVSCGPHGALTGGHAHADKLAIEVAAEGRPLIVDPGTGVYVGQPELRYRLRSSQAHSTVTVDDASSAEPGGPFSWQRTARGTLHRWITRERFDFFEGSHDGYAQLPDPVEVRRAVLFIKGGYWIVRDRVVAHGAHEAASRLVFPSDARVTRAAGGVMVEAGDPPACMAIGIAGAAHEAVLDEMPCSPSFRQLARCPVFTVRAAGTGEIELVMALVPGAGAAERPALERCRALHGSIYRIAAGPFEDRLGLTAAGRVADNELDADFEWCWVRTTGNAAPGEPVVRECVLIAGSTLRYGGMEVFRAAAPVGFVALWREGDTLYVDTDAAGPYAVSTLGASTVIGNGVPLEIHGQAARYTGRRARPRAVAMEASH